MFWFVGYPVIFQYAIQTAVLFKSLTNTRHINWIFLQATV